MEVHLLFIHLVILWILNDVGCQEGCREAGMYSCCTSGNCQVDRSLGNCFCDQTCYSKRDCCHDIEFICPLPPAGDGTDDVIGSGSGDLEAGSGTDDVIGSGSGSGDLEAGSGTMSTAITVSPDRAPSFIHPPTNTTYDISPQASNRRLFISLNIDFGHPAGRLVWTHNGTLVSSRTDHRVTILAGGGLTIRNTRFSDSGTYRLFISNRVGNLTADFTVRFQYLDVVYGYGVVVGTEVDLICSARGNPPSLYIRQWRTSSGEVLNSDEGDYFYFGGGEVLLQTFLTVVDPLDCLRAGSYVCEFGSGIPNNDYTVSRVVDCPIDPVDVRFQRSSYRVPEEVGMVEVCVIGTFHQYTTATVSITVSIVENSTSLALSGQDYNVMQRSLLLSRSNRTVCFSIEIVDDSVAEDTEEFVLVLKAVDGLSNITLPDTTTVTIQDNDVIDLVFEEPLYEVSESVGNESLHLALQVCVVHSNAWSMTSGVLDVAFVSFSDTAKKGVDFEPTHATFEVNLSNRDLRVCDCIKVLPDTYCEGDETFQVSLAYAKSGRVITSTTVKIIDDEYVHVTLEKSEYVVTEGGPPLEVCVLVEGELSTTVVLYLCTQNSTAKDVDDYEGLTSHRIEFAPRNVTFQRYCRNIPIVDDNIIEEKELFSLELMPGPQNPPGMVKVAPNDAATVSIVDDEVPGAVFVNGTPAVHGKNVVISFVKTGLFEAVDCTLKGPGKSPPITLACASGHVVFSDVPLRYQEFSISVVGRLPDATDMKLLQRSFRLDSPVCSVHLVNEGVKTLRTDSVSIEWEATGPSSESKVSRFMCKKDKLRTKFECTSPVVWRELAPGNHRLIVEPMPTPGCRRHIPKFIHFSL